MSKNLRIVHIVSGSSFGGVEGHICTLIKLMKGSNIQFEIVCDKSLKREFEKRLKNFNTGIHGLELNSRFFPAVYFKLVRLLKSLTPDIVHCHLYSATRLAAVASKMAGVPNVIETIHLEEAWRKGFKKHLLHFTDSVIGRFFVDHYIAVSKAVSSYYQQNKKVPAEKISVIYNTTELEANETKRDSFSLRLGFLGRLAEQKGIDILIRSTKILIERGFTPHLFIGGTGPLEEKLKSMVKELNIENAITFLGNVSDKSKFFQMTDIFVLPSRYEGFPLVLLEAGMCKMPVVATNVSGNPEIIVNEQTGLLVNSEDDMGLADAIIKYDDKGRRDRLADNLKNLIETEFSKEGYIQKMKKFYHSL